MTKRYFKGPHEPDSNDIEYVEFENGWPTRQIDVVGGHWFCSLDTFDAELGGGGLGDQSLEVLNLPPEWEITAEEFEAAWVEALRRRTSRTPR